MPSPFLSTGVQRWRGFLRLRSFGGDSNWSSTETVVGVGKGSVPTDTRIR